MSKNHWFTRLCVLATASIATFALASTGKSASPLSSPTTASASWQIECVDCPRQLSTGDNDMQLDSNGLPHIVYGGSPHLYYAWNDGTSWQIKTISDGSSMYASLALDGSDFPQISFIDTTANLLKTVSYDGVEWHHEVVDSAAAGRTSLVIDPVGHFHLSYFGGGYLKYAWQDGTQWHHQTVDTSSVVSSSGQNATELALDGMNRPHIVFYDDIHDAIKYASYDGTRWTIDMVDSQGWKGNFVSLAIDQLGQPHISYFDAAHEDLKYAWYDGSAWQIEAVDTEGSVGTYASLRLDPADQPHISYQDWDHHRLKHAWRTATGWQLETVDSHDPAGFYINITLRLGKDGEPHVSYFNANLSTLHYAKHHTGSWQIETVDISKPTGAFISLALDKEGQAHTSYGNLTSTFPPSGSLQYAEFNGANWSYTTIDTQLAYPTSLKLDPFGTPHIGYTTEEGRLKHAWRDTTGWHTEIIDQLADSWAGSLALDQAGRPHLVYQKDTLIQYAWHDGTSWHSETADRPEKGGGQPALTLDTLDHPHISYCAYEISCNPRYCVTYCKTLNYVWHDGVKWHSESVTSGGEYSSIALDSNDRPHIGYYESGVKVARYDGTTWQLETVDSSIYCNPSHRDNCLSLSLDKADRPHLAYFKSIATVINYALRTENGWRIETVDTTSSLLKTHISLALDQSGFPHIAYHADDILRYARQLPRLSLEKQADPERGLQAGDMLTYTLTIAGAGLNVTLVDPLPTQIAYVRNSLTQTITPSAVYHSASHTILWQGTLPTDTVQTIHFQVIASLAATDTRRLSASLVNTAWLTDTDHNRSLAAIVIVNGNYQFLPIVIRSD